MSDIFQQIKEGDALEVKSEFKQRMAECVLKLLQNKKVQLSENILKEDCEDKTKEVEDIVEERTTIRGKSYNTKVFKSEKEANAFMEKNEDWGVVDERNGKIFLAKLKDNGEPV